MPAVTPTPTPAAAADSIPGVIVERADGSVLSVDVEGGRLTLRFFDAEKRPMRSPFDSAAARWDSPVELGYQKSMLTLDGSGLRLVGVRLMRKPYAFVVRLRFFAADGAVTETHAVDLRALSPAPSPVP